MAPRKPNIRSKKRKFKKTSPPPRLSTAQIRRLTVDGEAVTDAPFAPDARRGMKDMPAGYEEGGKVGKKRVVIGPDSNLTDDELERYIQQLREPLVVKPVKKNKGGGLNAAIKRVKKVQGMQEGGRAMSDADRQRIGEITGSMMGKQSRQTAEITPELMEAMREIAKSNVRIPRPPRPKNISRDLPSISDADREAIMRMMGMEEGGEVPKKFKGFSKLPEDVQQQMNPTLAAKYEDGGVVRGMGRAYMGKPRKVKIR